MAAICVWLPAFAADKLDSSLTSMGAQQAGNATGSIPAWEGGIKTPPVSYQAGGFHPDPFADDKPLFIITSDNWTQYKDMLSAGHQAMFQKHKDYRMPVYPTRRSASYPDFVYQAIAQNAKTARLTADGNGVVDATVAVPFPSPQNGLQAIWDHLLRYQGHAYQKINPSAAVTSPNHVVASRLRESILFPRSVPGVTLNGRENILVYLKQEILSPPSMAGSILLVKDPLDKVKDLRQSWIYIPGLHRVNRAPFINYDELSPTSEGLRTYDQYDLFNGATDHYTWVLQGKQEMYVPYNAYRLADHKVRAKEILGSYFLNPEFTRYELHRVWKVEAVLKPGKHHIYARRVFYLDEDSWQILCSEEYNGQGNLWRFSEAHVINFYEVPLIRQAAVMYYDLKSNQYLAEEFQVEPTDYSVHLTPNDFSPAALRREGNR